MPSRAGGVLNRIPFSSVMVNTTPGTASYSPTNLAAPAGAAALGVFSMVTAGAAGGGVCATTRLGAGVSPWASCAITAATLTGT